MIGRMLFRPTRALKAIDMIRRFALAFARDDHALVDGQIRVIAIVVRVQGALHADNALNDGRKAREIDRHADIGAGELDRHVEDMLGVASDGPHELGTLSVGQTAENDGRTSVGMLRDVPGGADVADDRLVLQVVERQARGPRVQMEPVPIRELGQEQIDASVIEDGGLRREGGSDTASLSTIGEGLVIMLHVNSPAERCAWAKNHFFHHGQNVASLFSFVFFFKKSVIFLYIFFFLPSRFLKFCYTSGMPFSPNSFAFSMLNTSPENQIWCERIRAHLAKTCSPIQECQPEEADLVIVLGGDGSLLQAMREPHRAQAQFLALNTGHAGFLTTARSESLFIETIDAAFQGQLEVMQIPQLEVMHRSGSMTRSYICINDAYIERTMTWLDFRVELVRQESPRLVRLVRGSGIIVLTPIGSTTVMAHHFQAPIIDPELEAIYLKGVHDRQMPATGSVLSLAGHALHVTLTEIELNHGIPETDRTPPALYLDGIQKAHLAPQDRIEVRFLPHPATLLRVPGDLHWDRVHRGR